MGDEGKRATAARPESGLHTHTHPWRAQAEGMGGRGDGKGNGRPLTQSAQASRREPPDALLASQGMQNYSSNETAANAGHRGHPWPAQATAMRRNRRQSAGRLAIALPRPRLAAHHAQETHLYSNPATAGPPEAVGARGASASQTQSVGDTRAIGRTPPGGHTGKRGPHSPGPQQCLTRGAWRRSPGGS